MINKDIAKKIAYDYLGEVNRSGTGTAFDHACRVADYVRNRLGYESEELYISALFHDVLEDSSLTEDELRSIVKPDVFKIIKELTREPFDWETHEDKLRFKIEQNLALVNKSLEVRIIKCADRIDNMKVEDIPRSEKAYARIPYWIVESKLSMLGLAKITDPTAYSDLHSQLTKLESIHYGDVSKIEKRYMAQVSSFHPVMTIF